MKVWGGSRWRFGRAHAFFRALSAHYADDPTPVFGSVQDVSHFVPGIVGFDGLG